MTFDILLERLTQFEMVELEFKSAKGGLPHSLWETYSSFANTQGGEIFLGVGQKGHHFYVDGLSRVQIEAYKKQLWDGINNPQKVSAKVIQDKDIDTLETDEGWILRISIPRATLSLRPIYIDGDPKQVYVRNDEGDYRCSERDIRRMYAEANILEVSQDSVIMEGFSLENDIDNTSLREYRQIFTTRQSTHPWAGLPDIEFLKKLGAYRVDRRSGKEGITMAGMLMFGKSDSIMDASCLPSYFPDYREYMDSDPNARWTHRIYPDGTWEANLFQFFRRVYNRLQQSLPKPFALKAGSRIEDSPTHVAIREGFVNSIIHCDYTSNTNLITENHRTKFVFSNPGVLLVSLNQYFKGGESICRNKSLQTMFMMIGSAEKAGSGADRIWNGWKEGNYRNPSIIENEGRVILEMPLVDILEEDVKTKLIKRFGEKVLSLEHNKLLTLAACASDGVITNNQLQFILTSHPSDITDMLRGLCQDGYLISNGFGKGTKYQIAPLDTQHNKESSLFDDSVTTSDNLGSLEANVGSNFSYVGSTTAYVGTSSDNLYESRQRRREKPEQLRQNILDACPDFLPMTEIAKRVKRNLNYIQRIISSMLDDGLLERKYPDIPRHRNQQYRAKKER